MRKEQKIVVILLVVVAVIGIWFIKNNDDVKEPKQENIAVLENETNETFGIDLDIGKVDDVVNDKSDEIIIANIDEDTEVLETENQDINEVVEEQIIEQEVIEEEVIEIVEERKVLEDYELEVTDFNIEKLKEYGVPIMLDFGAAWCPPCQEMKPDVIELYNEYKDKMIILYLDVDKLENGTYGLPITVVPTQYFIDSDGNPYDISNQTNIYYGNVKDSEGTVKYSYHQGMLSKDEMLSIFKELGLDI